MPTVALLIPTFECGSFLRERLEEARRQTRPYDEIVVVDDASTDNTADILAGSDVRWERFDSNQGLPVVRRRLLEIAQSDFVHFQDADDPFYSDQFVEKVLPKADATTAGFASWKTFYTDGKVEEFDYQGVAPDVDWTAYLIPGHIHLNAIIYPRDFMRQHVVFDERLRIMGDLLANVSLANAGMTFRHHDEYLAALWKRQGSTLAKRSRRDLAETYVLLCRLMLETVDSAHHDVIADKLLYHIRYMAEHWGPEAVEADLALFERYRLHPRPAGGRLERWLARTFGRKTALRYLAWRTRATNDAEPRN